MSLLRKLQSFDAYPKVAKDMRVRTLSGAAISLVMFSVILFLFIAELSSFLRIEKVDELKIDGGGPGKLPISFDVTFSHIPCSLLSVDAMDVSGEQQFDLSHHINKRPIDKNGVTIGEVVKHEMTPRKSENSEESVKPRVSMSALCMSCYGAEEHPGQCCNTCDDVRKAYRARGWALGDLKSIEQCAKSGQTNEAFAAEMERDEGCQIFGELEVNKVSGNFHFAPGKSFEHANVHVHDLVSFSSNSFNISHHISKIRFGQTYPGAIHPLDNRTAIAQEAGGMWMYYTKVVPTSYLDISGNELSTNQFSVTQHHRKTLIDQPQQGHIGLPGVFIFYELSPIRVIVKEHRPSLLHFFSRVCAIIAGVFTLAGIFDKFIYHGVKGIEKKLQINKLS